MIRMDTECWRKRIAALGGLIDNSVDSRYSEPFREMFDIICATWPVPGRPIRNAAWRQLAKDGWLVQGRKILIEGTDRPRSYGIEAFRKKR